MREIINTQDAPSAIGPYSQAVKVGNQVFLSGQIAIDPKQGQLINGDVSAQARQVFNNITAVAQAAGGSLADVVKLTIYLVNADDFSALNRVMEEIFKPPYPARVTITVRQLPLNASVEIDATLILGA